MKILVLGVGVIGTVYGYMLKEGGNQVEHYIRPTSKNKDVNSLMVSLLDGRYSENGETVLGKYQIDHAIENSQYDYILVSLPAVNLEEAVATIAENGFKGTILLFCGIWESREYIDRIMNGREYILGYPVAGGRIDKENNHLECVLFDHIMLEGKTEHSVSNYDDIARSFGNLGIKQECPHDMSEWIWLHMGINAGVVSTIMSIAEGNTDKAVQAVEALMDNVGHLHRAIVAIRECMNIIASRGVKLRHYRGEVIPYLLPTWLSKHLMKRMFAKNELTRKIMLLHSNIPDLISVCQTVYRQGKSANVKAPVFYHNYDKYVTKLLQHTAI